jgi:hypothetical protein
MHETPAKPNKKSKSKAKRLRQFLNRDVNMGVSALQPATL